jgi:hypothetical protein
VVPRGRSPAGGARSARVRPHLRRHVRIGIHPNVDRMPVRPVPPEHRVPGFLESAETAWPGKPYPLGATWDGHGGTNFAIYSEHAHRGRALPLRRPGRRRADAQLPAARAHRVRLARLPPRRSGPAAVRLPGQRPVRARRGAPLQPVQAPRRPLREGARREGRLGRAPVRLPVRPAGRGLGARRRGQRRGVPKGVVIDPAFDWQDDRPPNIPWHRTVIYEAHVKGLTMRHPGRAGGDPRHLRGRRAPGDHRAPQVARRHRARAAPGPRDRRRRLPGGEGAAQLLGLQHASTSSPPPAATPRPGTTASRSGSSRRWCAGSTARGSR